MRKIILGVAVSMDNYIEGPKGEYDWCFTDQDYGMKEFLARIDAIFYGRKSYEMMMNMEAAGPNPFAHIKGYVFSHEQKQIQGDVELVTGDIEAQVKKIKAMKGKDIWLFGGASLTSSLMNVKLVDELWLAVHPIILGNGKPLFTDIKERIRARLLDTTSYNTGLVSLRYEITY